MSSVTKVLIVGLDAADRDTVLRLAGAGRLPTIRSFLDDGAWGETVNPTGLFVGAVWPSFFTALAPGHHGRHCFVQVLPGTYEVRKFWPEDVQGEPFWDVLSRAGRRCGIFDVPHTNPSLGLEGVQLVEWGCHDRIRPFRTWPPSVAEDVVARFGRHPVGRCDHYSRRGAYGPLLGDLLDGVERKGEVLAHYLDKGGWDLFLAVFSESHCVGHQCWHLHDPTHPRHNPNLVGGIGDPLEQVYEGLDAGLSRLVRSVGEETTVLVLLSHGMGPHYGATFMLDEILRRLEDGNRPPPLRVTARRQARRVGRRALREPRRLLGLPSRHKRILDSGRRYFQVPNNDVYGGIRVNVVGREPRGRVRPGAEFEEVCAALRRDLLALVDNETGRPVVQEVFRTDELHGGDASGGFPDLLVEWDQRKPVRSISSPQTGRIEAEYKGRRTGDHKPGGLLLARGPSVSPGRLPEPVPVTDIAPTACALLGEDLPGADGAPIPQLLSSGTPLPASASDGRRIDVNPDGSR